MRYFLIIIISLFLLTSCKTTPDPEEQLNIDFSCYNMCMDTTRGMKLSQLESFCKSQCPGAENKLQFPLGY